MGSPSIETLQDQHTRRMTRARHVCVAYRASWGPISRQGFPVFWFLLVITSALQSATRLYCLTIWRPSKRNPNPQLGGWPLLPQRGFCEPCAVTVATVCFFHSLHLWKSTNQPTYQPKPYAVASSCAARPMHPSSCTPWPWLLMATFAQQVSGYGEAWGWCHCPPKAKSSDPRALPRAICSLRLPQAMRALLHSTHRSAAHKSKPDCWACLPFPLSCLSITYKYFALVL